MSRLTLFALLILHTTLSAQYKPWGDPEKDLHIYSKSEIRDFLKQAPHGEELGHYARSSRAYSIASYVFYTAAAGSAILALYGTTIPSDVNASGITGDFIFKFYGGIALGNAIIGGVLSHYSKKKLRQGLMSYYF